MGRVPVSKRYLILAAVCALAVGGLAQAQSAPPAGVTLTADQVVKARQSAFMLSAADFGGMKGFIDHGDEVAPLAFNSGALVRWANTIPTMFPAGTGPGQVTVPTKARPEIWSDRAGFEAAAANYAAEATKLRDLAKAGDKPGFATQWGVVRQSCSACHDKYRAK